MKSKLIRVTKRQPCTICKHGDWCSYTEDYAICMRVESDRRTKNGGWLHSLGGQVSVVLPTHVIHDRADRPTLHAIYTKLILDHLTLSTEHRGKLLERGLSNQAIDENGYRSTPGPIFAKNIARYLAEFDLTGVPGFYKNGDWNIVNPGQGIMIPVRDSQSRIRGFQVRRDEGEPKFLWFSSASKPHGSSSGAPIHFSKPDLIRTQRKAIITEGSLKADIISHKLNCCVIGLAGVSTIPPNFGQKLKRLFPELRETSIAYDADFQSNTQVRQQLFRLINNLSLALLGVQIWTWTGAKGLDDLLTT